LSNKFTIGPTTHATLVSFYKEGELNWISTDEGLLFVGLALQGWDIVFRIITQYNSFKGFWPLETRWDYSFNLFVKDAHASYDMLFSVAPLKIKGIPKWFCHQSITNQKKIKNKI
jgi:hypothetical protein